MFQPTPALVLALFLGTVAAAQPSPLARVPQQREVFLPSSPDAPAPEVYVAPGSLTTLVMDGPLERASVVLDERDFALVDVGDRTLTLEPRRGWSAEKRLGLKVRLKDGAPVALVVAAHPTLVDGRVDVKRPRPVEALQAELERKDAQLAALHAQCGEGGLMELLRSKMLDGRGVLARSVDASGLSSSKAGLLLVVGVSYRATKWTLVDITVKNLPEQAPWMPLKARLVGPGGFTAKVVAMWTEKPRLAAGEEGRIIVQTEAPRWRADTVLRLEIEDSGGGRLLSIPGVTL